MKHMITSGRQFSMKLDCRMSILRYIQNYYELNKPVFIKTKFYDI